MGLTGESTDLTYWGFLGLSAVLGLGWLSVDGLWFSGFLKHSIEIKSSGFDTKNYHQIRRYFSTRRLEGYCR